MTDVRIKTYSEANPEIRSDRDGDRHIAAPITEKADNEMQQRAREREAVRAYRLTRDSTNSFSVDMGDREVKDLRPIVALESTERLSERIISRINELVLAVRRDGLSPSSNRAELSFFETFKRDLYQFRANAHSRGLLPQDVQKTLNQVDRLLQSPTGVMDAEDRQLVAGEIMMSAAHPKGIDQGHFNTCNVATVESRAFARNPGEAARVVADIAMTGFYETTEKYAMPDGSMVPLQIKGPTSKDRDAVFYPASGYRTYTGQIFQDVAVNIFYELGNRLRGTHLEYQVVDPNVKDRHDTGERIYDNDKKQFQSEATNPELPDQALPIIMDAITGTSHSRDLLLVDDNYHYGPKDNLTTVKSLGDLKEELARLKDNHLLPVILKVNCLCEPFYNDGGLDKASGLSAPHVVTVTDYDAGKGFVMVDNEWGAASDHEKKNPIKIEQLYVAMQVTSDAIKALQTQLDDDKKQGRFDPRKHMELARLSNIVGDITDDAYENDFKSEVRAVSYRWNKLSFQERQRESEGLVAMSHNLQAEQRGAFVDTIYKHGLISSQVYSKEEAAAKTAANEPPVNPFDGFESFDLIPDGQDPPKKDRPS